MPTTQVAGPWEESSAGASAISTGQPAQPQDESADKIEFAPPDVAASPVPTRPVSPWPEPLALIEQLKALSDQPCECSWAEQVLAELTELASAERLASPESRTSLDKLLIFAEKAQSQPGGEACRNCDSEMLRAAYALRRRLAIWQAVYDLAERRPASPATAEIVWKTMVERVEAVEALLEGHPYEKDWQVVLRLPEAKYAARAGPLWDRTIQRDLARSILTQIKSAPLDAHQRAFLERPTLVALGNELRHWATEPIDYGEFLRQLEQWEMAPTAPTERMLAATWDNLCYSACPLEMNLAEQLDAHYRNANIRIAATEDFLNRFIPEMKATEQPVDDEILGTRVSGQSATSTRLFVRLLPDSSRVRLRLEAHGVVISDTASLKWPVAISVSGESAYLARKLFLLDRHGTLSSHTTASARSCTTLSELRSQFDAIPILGPLVRTIARDRHHRQQEAYHMEMEKRVAHRARQRLDRESGERFALVRERLESYWIQPLRDLRLDPATLGVITTDREVILRCRVAGPHQLAASTPLPGLPARSVASLHVHQSAINNFIQQIDLDGRRGDLRALYQELALHLRAGDTNVPDEIPPDVEIEFASDQAVRIDCDDDRIAVTIKVAELDRGPHRWRDFEVRGHYRLQPTGPSFRLERDGSIELVGQRLGLRNRIALRGIFTKFFSDRQGISLVSAPMENDNRVSTLTIQEYAIDDGWIALALGDRMRAKQPLVAGREGEAEKSERSTR